MKKYKVLCPLSNFKIQSAFGIPEGMSDETAMNLVKERGKQLVEGIELCDGINVKLISKEDLDYLNAHRYFFSRGALIVQAGMFVLDKEISEEDRPNSRIEEKMLNIVLGLRLLKKGDLLSNAVFSYPSSKEEQRMSAYWEEDSIPQFLGPEYILEFDDIPVLKTLLVKIQETDFPKRGSLHLACKRFQRTYGESDAEDKLIDLMIAFEALFLKGEKVGASSGQIVAVACSHLLGRNDEERDRIRASLLKAYKARNSIVHGSGYSPVVEGYTVIEDLRSIVSEIEDYLRESLKRLLD